MLNCCSHESICAALPQLREKLASRPGPACQLGAYANGFETIRRTTKANDTEASNIDLI